MVHPGSACRLGQRHRPADRCANVQSLRPFSVAESCFRHVAVCCLRLIPNQIAAIDCNDCVACSNLSGAHDSPCRADREGFISIDEFLRCNGGPADVFAVGDVASSAAHPRPKAGVFAVRQGPVLAENLRR